MFATCQQGHGSLEAEPSASQPYARAKWSLARHFKVSACVKYVETSASQYLKDEEFLPAEHLPLAAAAGRCCVWMSGYSAAELLRGRCVSLFLVGTGQARALTRCAADSPTGSASAPSAWWTGFSWHSRYRLLEQLENIVLKGTHLLKGSCGKGWVFAFFQSTSQEAGLAHC